MQKILLLPIIICLLLTASIELSHAVISCHCFQDRSFDPARPKASDPYLLATTQNSLMSAALDVSKKNIVRAKMGGADADLLWVVYYLSDRTGLEVDDLFSAWVSGAGWGEVAATISHSAGRLDQPFVEAFRTPSDLQALARGAFHAVAVVQLGFDRETLLSLEKSGADRQQQSLALFLSLILGDDPAVIYANVVAGKISWGETLASCGLTADQIEKSWVKLIKMQKVAIGQVLVSVSVKDVAVRNNN